VRSDAGAAQTGAFNASASAVASLQPLPRAIAAP
jgi:hypothetical protein